MTRTRAGQSRLIRELGTLRNEVDRLRGGGVGAMPMEASESFCNKTFPGRYDLGVSWLICKSVEKFWTKIGSRVLDQAIDSATAKFSETIVDTYLVSYLYPIMKRSAQKTTAPDVYYNAPDILPNPNMSIEDIHTNPDEHMKVFSFIKALQKADKNGKPLPSALFAGAPGTGKTTLASLLANAGNFEVKIFSGGAMKLWLPKEFSHTFQWVDKERSDGKKIIMIIDEGEALFRKAFNKRSEQLQTFLTATGSRSAHFTFVVTTNHAEEFDEAVVRRFTTIVDFELPLPTQRMNILRHYLNKYHKEGMNFEYSENFFDEQSEDYKKIAKASEGLSGAHLENISRNAVGQAAYFNDGILTLDILLYHIHDCHASNTKIEAKKIEAEKKRREEAKLNYIAAMAEKNLNLVEDGTHDDDDDDY